MPLWIQVLLSLNTAAWAIVVLLLVLVLLLAVSFTFMFFKGVKIARAFYRLQK